MFKRLTYLFSCKRITALAAPFAIWLVVLLLAQPSAAQPALNVWSSNGPNGDVSSVIVNPINPNIIYATGEFGVFKSINNGASWNVSNEGLPGNARLAIDPINPNILYAGTAQGVFKTTNSGANWSRTNSPLVGIGRLAVAPGNPGIVYAATATNILVTANGGETWNTRPFPVPDVYLELLVVDPQNPNVIYTFVSDYDFFIGLFKSTDGGVSWTGIYYSDSGLTVATTALKIDSANPNIIYAATYFGIYKSTNGGASWTLRNSLNAPLFLAIDPVAAGTLYTARYNGGGYDVYRSANDGVTWSLFNTGYPGFNVNDLEFDHTGRFLHAATPAGVFSVRVREDSAACPNPIDCFEFFVRQHYQDFLNREPDAGGLAYWTGQLEQCGADAACIHQRRIGVSAAFFIESEFQETGYFVYRLYRASYGNLPAPNQTRANVTYGEFKQDRAALIGGPDLEQAKQMLVNNWTQRSRFRNEYPLTLSNADFVNRLFDQAGLFPFTAERQAEIDAMNTQGRTRAQVLRNVLELPPFRSREYNPAFVLMQYFGYLQRDPDQAGYDFWLNAVVNSEPNNYRGMVCAFLTATEYQRRFSNIVTRSNADCAP